MSTGSTTTSTTAKTLQRKAPIPAPRPVHLKPKPKPKPTIVPRGSGKVTAGSKVNRVHDLAKKFESTPATVTTTKKTSTSSSSSTTTTSKKGLIQDNSNLSKPIISRPSTATSTSATAVVARNHSQNHRLPSVERRFSKPQTKRFYCRSVTRKRSSLIRQFRSTGDLIAYSNSSLTPSSSSTLEGDILSDINGSAEMNGCKMIKSKSVNEEELSVLGMAEEKKDDGSAMPKVTGSNKRPPPIPAVPPKKSNITVVRVSSMSAAGVASRPNQAPPKPPPKPSKIMLSKTLRHLRPITPDDENSSSLSPRSDHQQQLQKKKTDEEVEPQPSTSSAAADNDQKLSTSAKNEEKRKTWIRSRSSIRKPSIRPPPPPVSPKPTGLGKATWQQQPIRHSTSASDLYQAMPSPEDDLKEAIWGSEVKPSVPKMPPPQPPKSKADDEHFDEVYEDIDIGFNPAYRDNSPTPLHQTLKSVPYSPKYQKRSQQRRNIPFIQTTSNDRELIYHAYASDQGEDDQHGMAQSFNNSWGDSNNLSSILSAAEKRRSHHFGTWGAGRRNKSGTAKTRPPSGGALELEKLLRIKSEIQLNISKKVDKIKSKVSHSPALSKSMRASSGNVFVDPKILQTDSNPSPSTSQKQKQEAYLYGDNWSTDDEEDDDGIDEVYGHGKVPSSGSPSVIYSSSNNSSNNYPIEKSKSAGNALNFWKSIDSALTIGKRNGGKEAAARPSCLPIQTPSNFNEPPPPPPKSSLLDEIESEYMQTEFCRKRQTPVQTPMSTSQPPPPPPTSLPPSQSFPNLKDIQNAIDDDDDEDEDEHIESELVEEEALDAIDDEEVVVDEDDDEMPSDALELQKKQTYQSRLPEPQPLYQIYMLHEQEKMLEVGASATTSGASSASGDTGMVEADSCCGSLAAENEDTLSSIIRRQSSSISTDSGRGCDSSSNLTSNTSMRRERLTAASIYGSQRSLWCELPEVKSAGLLNQLDDNSKKLQEAFFEVITSEASYLRSINFLINHFISAPEFLGTGMKPSIITAAERKHLFSNIINVRDCSERLLCDLENRLEDNLILSDVNDILCEHFEKYFDAYVKYCSNQVYQDRTLKRLKALNPQFLSCITRIEADRRCQGLDMRSFLMLPMQRITRYPLLVYAILERVPPNSEIQRNAAKALLLANQVVWNCNEGARRMERTEQLLDIERRLIYKTADLKRIPLVTSGRYVVKNGQVLQIFERRAKGLLQSKQKTRNLYLFLFSDMLLIAKKRLNGTFICKDYAQRRFVVVEPVEAHSHKVPIGAIASLPSKSHLFVCILLQNAFGKQVELLLNVESESDRERWLTAMRPPTCSNPDEKIYAEWDCPQAVGVHHYSANQEDELELEPGDLINILRKMPDGWYYGERTRDGKGGWFPSSYVQQVLNDHVRANNYKQRLKVIEAAAVYRAQQQAAEKAATSGSDLTTPTAPGIPQHGNGGGGGATPLIDRLRRLSNPRGFFVNL